MIQKGFRVEVLNAGHVTLVDWMGSDERICEAARVSYADASKRSNDRNLIRYMLNHDHGSPFEMCSVTFRIRLPIFVARQMVRHRTARCLAGDTCLQFDLPGGIRRRGNQCYSLSVKEVFQRFQPTQNRVRSKQKNPFHKRDRVRCMLLRSYNEDTKEIYHTRIRDIWSNGVRPVLKVWFTDGSFLKATYDHRCLTEFGWLELQEAIDRKALFVGLGREYGITSFDIPFSEQEIATEEWRVVPSNPKYSVSNLGRVRSHLNTKNKPLPTPKLKKITGVPNGYRVVSLSEHGKSFARLVHHLVLEAFRGEKVDRALDTETRHLDGNRANNRLDNLAVGSRKENAQDRVNSGASQRLSPVMKEVAYWESGGEEEVFDLSVEGPYHNFSANNLIVHNCNEISGRYSELPADFYDYNLQGLPLQSQSNKQGSANEQIEDVDFWTEGLQNHNDAAFEIYQDLLDAGCSKEIARCHLPLSTYTEWYWQCDLRNLFNFFRLRMDSHAQAEIRVYAEAMYEMVKELFPLACEAFEDYILNSMKLSAMEIKALAYVTSPHIATKTLAEENDEQGWGMSKRELEAFEKKLARLGW